MNNAPQNERQQTTKRTIEKYQESIEQLDRENSKLASNIHNLERELELLRSDMVVHSKKLENSSQCGSFIVFIIIAIFTIYIFLWPAKKV